MQPLQEARQKATAGLQVVRVAGSFQAPLWPALQSLGPSAVIPHVPRRLSFSHSPLVLRSSCSHWGSMLCTVMKSVAATLCGLLPCTPPLISYRVAGGPDSPIALPLVLYRVFMLFTHGRSVGGAGCQCRPQRSLSSSAAPGAAVSTALATRRLFSPANMSATPSTHSSPL